MNVGPALLGYQYLSTGAHLCVDCAPSARKRIEYALPMTTRKAIRDPETSAQCDACGVKLGALTGDDVTGTDDADDLDPFESPFPRRPHWTDIVSDVGRRYGIDTSVRMALVAALAPYMRDGGP